MHWPGFTALSAIVFTFVPFASANLLSRRLLDLDPLDFLPVGVLRCGTPHADTSHALKRCRSELCARRIEALACLDALGRLHDVDEPRRNCTSVFDGRRAGRSLGCTLKQQLGDASRWTTLDSCIDSCFRAGMPFVAASAEARICHCLSTAPLTHECNDAETLPLYASGFDQGPAIRRPLTLSEPTVAGAPGSRILFLLTVAGRSDAQIRRLLRSIYRDRHFYLIHVDISNEVLFRRLQPVNIERRYSNVRFLRKRHATIWGGSRLLLMLLESIETAILEFQWSFDYFVNLSESDFLIKNVDELAEFLLINDGLNFVKSHGRSQQQFSSQQGLDRIFLQCEGRMWRITRRAMPRRIRMDGGSDWFVLSRAFLNFLLSPEAAPTRRALESFFVLTLLPVETYFHTFLHNTRFCDTIVNGNLRLTKWIRRRGCQCQHRDVVDWCGCSPNVITASDAARLERLQLPHTPTFFARKFDPLIDIGIINTLEGTSNAERRGWQRFWQNIFDDSADAAGTRPRRYLPLFNFLAKRAREHIWPPVPLDDVVDCYDDNAVHVEQATILVGPNHAHLVLARRAPLLVRFRTQSSEYEALYRARSLVMHESPPPPPPAEIDAIDRNAPDVMRDRRWPQWLEALAVGSECDVKELVFRNHINAIVLPDDRLTLLVGFNRSFLRSRPQELPPIFVDAFVTVVRPDGSVASNSKHVLNETAAEDGRQALVLTDPNSDMATGLWRALLVDANSSIDGLRKAKRIAELKFFVLPPNPSTPYVHTTRLLESELEQFYAFDDICQVMPVDFATAPSAEVTKACHTEVWSSLAPDPKSDF